MIVAVAAQANRPFIEWDWIVRNADRIWEQTLEHLFFTGTSVLAGLVISLALAALAISRRGLYGPIVALGGILYSIPSLAAFGFLVPFFGLFSDSTAIIALTSYTILILVRNIVTGIEGVPEDVHEAAVAMGYRPWRLFKDIQLPLALPAIVAGLRIATVTVVGLVTVTALLGRGGLGRFILDGMAYSTGFVPTPILVGTALSVVLASVLDLALLLLQRVLTPWRRRTAGP